MFRKWVGSSPPNHTAPSSLLLLKLCKFLVLGSDLAMTIGLHFNNLVSLANLRMGGAKSSGLGLRPPESK